MVGRFFHPLELQSYEELTEGYFNVAYEVTLSSGEAVILKVAPANGIRVMTHEKYHVCGGPGDGDGAGAWRNSRS